MATPVHTTWNQFKDNLRSFLNVEADTGMLFARIALESDGPRAARNQRNARIAYDSAMHHLHDVALGKDDREKIAAKLALLKTTLQELGEVL